MMKKIPYLLRKWRVLTVGISLYLAIILWQIKEWIMAEKYSDLDSGVQSIVISVIVLTIITGLFTIANKANEPIGRDYDESSKDDTN